MKMFAQIITKVLIIISLTLVSNISVQAQAIDISDHWAQPEITRYLNQDIVKGYEDGTFKPNNPITRVEFVKIVNNIFNYTEKSNITFKDVSSTNWYTDEISKAVAAGVIKGDGNGNIRPNDYIKRQEAALILYRAFDLSVEDKNAGSSFNDAKLISDWAKDALSAMVEAGYIKGNPDNTVRPVDNITRAETVKLVSNIVCEIYTKHGTYSQNVNGNAIVNTRDVKLENMVINGNLYLAEGIGNGDVHLDNVTVKGKTIVRGGGENSITITNSTAEVLIVAKIDGKVRILTKGEVTKIPLTILKNGGKLEGVGFQNVVIGNEVPQGANIKLNGDFSLVSIEAKGIGLNIESGKVEKLVIKESAFGTIVETSKDSAVTELSVGANAQIKGTGRIETAIITSNNVTIEAKPDKINIGNGLTATVNGSIYGDNESSAIPEVPGGGSGSSGGSNSPVLPTLTSVSIKEAFTEGEYANLGDFVDIDIVSNKKISAPIVKFGDYSVTATGSNTVWSAVYHIPSTYPEGYINFSISYSDLNGRQGQIVTTTTDNSKVLFDKTSPAIIQKSINKVGDTARVQFTTQDSFSGLKQIIVYRSSIKSNILTENVTGSVYEMSFELPQSDEYWFLLTDNAGNTTKYAIKTNLILDENNSEFAKWYIAGAIEGVSTGENVIINADGTHTPSALPQYRYGVVNDIDNSVGNERIEIFSDGLETTYSVSNSVYNSSLDSLFNVKVADFIRFTVDTDGKFNGGNTNSEKEANFLINRQIAENTNYADFQDSIIQSVVNESTITFQPDGNGNSKENITLAQDCIIYDIRDASQIKIGSKDDLQSGMIVVGLAKDLYYGDYDVLVIIY